jgi:hypothetical protein
MASMNFKLLICLLILSTLRRVRHDAMDYLLWIMRDKDQDARSRLDDCEVAAPYCHARLSSIELSGPAGGPVSVQTSQKLDISDLNDEELDILERVHRKTIALQDC